MIRRHRISSGSLNLHVMAGRAALPLGITASTLPILLDPIGPLAAAVNFNLNTFNQLLDYLICNLRPMANFAGFNLISGGSLEWGVAGLLLPRGE